MARMEERLEEHIRRTNDRFMRAQDDVEANRILINEVESHGRRWALRVVGLKAPTEKPEKSDVSKELVLQFISTHLKINNTRLGDLDCAHRIGAIKDGKQAILVRLFRRNIVEDLMRQKKILKGSGLVLFDDLTQANRRFLLYLSKRRDVESSWSMGGSIYAKLKNGGERIKVGITDNLDYVLRPQRPEATLPTIQSLTENMHILDEAEIAQGVTGPTVNDVVTAP